MEFVNKEGLERGFNVSTLRERIKASLWCIGVSDAKELVKQWKKAYPLDKFGREAARKWLTAEVPPQYMKPVTAHKLGALTGCDPHWIQFGKGDPRGSKSLTQKQREILELFEKLRPGRQDRLIEAAYDSLAAQTTIEPDADMQPTKEPVKAENINN